MVPSFVVAGRFQREYILPSSGPPLLDAPGGNVLYAAAGLAIWESAIGLLSRVSEDLPRTWLKDLEKHGFDTRGIRILPGSLDMRYFAAYTDFEHGSETSPVSHFARREMTFPKALLGYQPPSDNKKKPAQPDPLTPTAADLPREYLDARAVHICPLDFTTQSQLAAAFRGGTVATISLDPARDTMTPRLMRDLRLLLQGITLFLPSEAELRALFWGETHDLWEMAEDISTYGCEIIIVKRGAHGHLVYDGGAKRRWEIPAYDARKVDPTGVGDAFGGGCLAGYQKSFDPLEAALRGTVSASLKMEGAGALYPLEVLPGLAEARYQALSDMIREV
ncbi:MAG TPA: carbohydrate kinase family protein [Anaerolineales bacterium]